MNIIFLLIFVSLIIALGFLAAFFWAVKSGQYEDDYTPSVRILFDDTKKKNHADFKTDSLHPTRTVDNSSNNFGNTQSKIQ